MVAVCIICGNRWDQADNGAQCLRCRSDEVVDLRPLAPVDRFMQRQAESWPNLARPPLGVWCFFLWVAWAAEETVCVECAPYPGHYRRG